MNTPHRPTKEPDDQDIAALFDAQSVTAPEELDATLIEAAKQALTEASSVSEPQPTIKLLSKASNRWFALAATVVVGISIAPLLLKSPESSLDAPMATTPMAENNFSKGGSAGDPLLEENGTLPVKNNELKSTTADQVALQSPEPEAPSEEVVSKTTQSLSARSFSTTAATLLPSETESGLKKTGNNKYRDNADAWINEILRLESVGNKRQALAEYALFRDKYPDYKPEFKLRSLMDESAAEQNP